MICVCTHKQIHKITSQYIWDCKSLSMPPTRTSHSPDVAVCFLVIHYGISWEVFLLFSVYPKLFCCETLLVFVSYQLFLSFVVTKFPKDSNCKGKFYVQENTYALGEIACGFLGLPSLKLLIKHRWGKNETSIPSHSWQMHSLMLVLRSTCDPY